MPETTHLIAFSLIALGMVLSPGPNMVYLISRSICQGKKAGLITLCGIALGFVIYMLGAVFGITSFLLTVPYAFDSLRVVGAVYLLYLAWQALRPGAKSVLQSKNLPAQSNKRLLISGLMTNLLNPKIAVMYLSLLPQFITLDGASVLTQSLTLGSIQILISITVNATIVVMASKVADFMLRRPNYGLVQQWLMGSVLLALSMQMLLSNT